MVAILAKLDTFRGDSRFTTWAYRAIVLEGVPLEAMVSQSGLKRGAIYKAVFDARRKIRIHLSANGYLDGVVRDQIDYRQRCAR